jgi:hypothetical protein
LIATACIACRVPGRVLRNGRGQITLHLPEDWHREAEWMNLFPSRLRATRPDGLGRQTRSPRPTAPIGNPEGHPKIPGTSRREVNGKSITPTAPHHEHLAAVTCINPSPEFMRWIEA